MTTLAEHMIVVRANNCPPMLEKSMYNSWSSSMLLYIKGKEHGIIMLNSVLEGPLIYGTIEENGVTRLKTYKDPSDKENIQDDCDLRATNIVLQGLPLDVYSLVNHHQVAKQIWDRVKLLMKGTKLTQQERECKLYNEFDRFVSWSKFVTDVKLAKDMHESNYDELYAYLSQHEANVTNVCVMHERFPDSLALCQSFDGMGSKSNATSSVINKNRGNNAAVPARESGQTLDEEKLPFLADLRVTESQNTQTTMTHNAAFHTDDLDAYDSDCDEAPGAKAILTANLSSYDCDVISEKAQRIQPTLYDGNMITKKHDVISVVDYEETLILAEESRLKMIEKQNNPISKEKKINISPVNYSELNKLSEHFGKYFVPQKELSVELAFWESFTDFDNGLYSELNEVKMVFNQMEAAVKQCSIDKKYFYIQKKELFLECDRLLEHIICQDVMNIVMHADVLPETVFPVNNDYLVHDNLEVERLE
ncbi:hypothetical protein Tco_0420428 [Tanacetum coccineum]